MKIQLGHTIIESRHLQESCVCQTRIGDDKIRQTSVDYRQVHNIQSMLEIVRIPT